MFSFHYLVKNILLFSFFAIYSVYGDVKSTSGDLKFDSNNDGVPEVFLNSDGLGVFTSSPSSNLSVSGNASISDELVIGRQTAGNSTLEVDGTLGMSFQLVSDNLTLGSTSVVLADSSGGNISLTLPYASNVLGRIYTIKKINNFNEVTINALESDSIDGLGAIELLGEQGSELPTIQLISNGQRWYSLISSMSVLPTASENLIGWWKLDETEGIVAYDSSGVGNNGDLNGSMTFSGNGVEGVNGRALSFDGSGTNDDHVDLGNAISLSTNTSLTITAWMKPLDSIQGYAISSWTSGQWTYNLTWTSSAYQFIVRGTDNSSKSSGTSVGSLNTWTHVTGVADATTGMVKLYLNGIEKNSGSGWDGSWHNVDADDFIAWKDDSNESFPGELDDVRFYNRALSDSEIFAVFEGK